MSSTSNTGSYRIEHSFIKFPAIYTESSCIKVWLVDLFLCISLVDVYNIIMWMNDFEKTVMKYCSLVIRQNKWCTLICFCMDIGQCVRMTQREHVSDLLSFGFLLRISSSCSHLCALMHSCTLSVTPVKKLSSLTMLIQFKAVPKRIELRKRA